MEGKKKKKYNKSMLNNNRYILIKVVACTRLEKVLQSGTMFTSH
jgi:hypothetical protein